MGVKSDTNWLGTIATAVAVLATLTTAVGGYYDVRSRGEQTQADVKLLREYTVASVKTIADRQEKFEMLALTRWAKVDDVLDQLLTRGVRNETNISSILSAIVELAAEIRKAKEKS
jgi:uncharacterized protein HemX